MNCLLFSTLEEGRIDAFRLSHQGTEKSPNRIRRKLSFPPSPSPAFLPSMSNPGPANSSSNAIDNDAQSTRIDHSSSKGKQRQTDEPTSSTSSNQSNGITSRITRGMGGLSLNGIAPSASDLNSILSSGGKAVASQNSIAGPSSDSQSASQQFHQDHSSNLAGTSSSNVNSSSASKPSFRSNTASTSTETNSLNSSYTDFNPSSTSIQSPSFNPTQTSFNQLSSSSDPFSPYNQGPYQSAKDLDPGLYAHAQAYRDTNPSFWSHGKHHELEQSWNKIQENGGGGGGVDLEDPAYHEAWARSIPGPIFPSFKMENGNEFGRDEVESSFGNGDGIENDFMDLLSKEEEREEERKSFQNPITNFNPSSSQPFHPNITSEWKPPSPSSSPTITTEQLKLHLDLSELQDGKGNDEQRKLEGLKPNDDQEHLQEGVYARNPEEALKSFWRGDQDRREKFEEKRKELDSLREGDDEKLRELLKSYLPRGDWIDVSLHIEYLHFGTEFSKKETFLFTDVTFFNSDLG